MATKPKTHPYAIMYTDNTHVIYEITATDFSNISKAMIEGMHAVAIADIGVITLVDVRAVVKQKLEEPPVESADPPMTEQEKEWVQMLRREVGYN